MNINRLVVNGCSYMHRYALGNGHTDLALQLGISESTSLAMPGSCNSRIIRTCLRDSYTAQQPTLYIVGLSFLSRVEIPVNGINDALEGKWISLQNYVNPGHRYEDHWTHNDTRALLDLNIKLELLSTRDRFENLIYNLLSVVDSILSRGHNILIYKQVDDVHPDIFDQIPALSYCPPANFVQGLTWSAVPWQFKQKVQWNKDDEKLPLEVRHPVSGDHFVLNNFLVNYINDVSV